MRSPPVRRSLLRGSLDEVPRRLAAITEARPRGDRLAPLLDQLLQLLRLVVANRPCPMCRPQLPREIIEVAEGGGFNGRSELFSKPVGLSKTEVDVFVSSLPLGWGRITSQSEHRSGKRCFPVDRFCAVWDLVTELLRSITTQKTARQGGLFAFQCCAADIISVDVTFARTAILPLHATKAPADLPRKITALADQITCTVNELFTASGPRCAQRSKCTIAQWSNRTIANRSKCPSEQMHDGTMAKRSMCQCEQSRSRATRVASGKPRFPSTSPQPLPHPAST